MAKCLLVTFLAMALAAAVLIWPAYGQDNTPCSASVLTSFTPCMNLLTNSSYNGSSPTAACCSSLKSLANGGMDCLCLIGTANAPFRLPINRTLAVSLPRSCNMPGVPLQCKAHVAPVAAPAPISLTPTLSPDASLSPQASPQAGAPESDTTPTSSPSSTTGGAGAPTATTGSWPVLTPPASSAVPTYSLSPAFLLSALAFLVVKCH